MDDPETTQECVFGYEEYVKAIDEMINALLRPYVDEAEREDKELRLMCRKP